ncbi:MAG: YncE family protein [Acidobacteriia bacterium]|nr:YncE family protein [Terriglobia bacterium]
MPQTTARRVITLFAGTTVLALGVILFAASRSHAAAPAPGPSGYRVIKTVPVGGDGFWDYLTVDSPARRLYISHATHVAVMDIDSDTIVGDIPDTEGVHGIALAPELNRGFTSNGRANTVTIFDLKTLKTLGTVKTGTNPDAIVFDGVTKRVFTMNGRSHDSTAINAADGSVVGTLELGGKPEFAVADGTGSIYVNIEDQSELVRFDAQKLTILNRWPLAPCEEPSGLAMDLKTHRLFAGCHNRMMAVVDAETGKVIATPAIGEGVDANAFDAGTKDAFASNGDGTLTVVHEDSPEKFTVVENVPTKRSARTMALDSETHRLYLSAADLGPPAEGQRRPSIVPGSFVILIVGK